MTAPDDLAAMVLAAGFGKRMRPVTDTRPKPLVAVGGRTMLDRALDRLVAAGIRRAVVNVHYLGDMIVAHLADRHDLAITISDERAAPEPLETGGGIRLALSRLGPTFLVLNSDSLWTEPGPSNIARIITGWDPERMDILLLLAPRESLGYDGRGDYRLASDGRLARREAAGTAPHVYAGVALVKAALFAEAPAGAFSLNVLFDRAERAGRLFGLKLDGDWLHVGTPEALEAAESRLAALP